MTDKGSGQFWGYVTYAQHAEDLMLLNIFDLIGVKKPSYLDIGANHPIEISNTALLYERGSRGVNVEANPACMAEFIKLRPEDKNVNLGVGPVEGLFPFYIRDATSGLNTFKREELENIGQPIRQQILVRVITITQLVDTYCGGVYSDILLIDAEGMDLEILKSADFSRSSPKVIVVETRKHKGSEMKSVLESIGYFCFCRLQENLIFVRNEFKELLY